MSRARILHRVRRLVDEAAEVMPDRTGDERRQWVVDRVGAELDRLCEWPDTPAGRVAEEADGYVARALLDALVHVVWLSRHNVTGRGPSGG